MFSSWSSDSQKGEVLQLNVGGQTFLTTKETLVNDKSTNLYKLVMDEPRMYKDALFIDRDPTHFRHILNFLRSGMLNIKADLTLSNELLVEADYYQIQGLKDLLQATLPDTKKHVESQELRKWRERFEQLEDEVKNLRQEVAELKKEDS
eukprot:TRINITY_DN14565_c0_g1_i1.p1 TRINITY_DN14565_c0_g1~~TRINITY_DN14565_c0_g1_i1.p1  ORF type:complete len:149 (-),score=26.25 TRINITY_DN14565_c0_g1_i1:25-471(-)